MRALFLTLALANLLFFGWSYWIDKPAVGVVMAGVPAAEAEAEASSLSGAALA